MIAVDSLRTKTACRSPLTPRQSLRGGYRASLEGASIGDLQAIGLVTRINKRLQGQVFEEALVYWLSACLDGVLKKLWLKAHAIRTRGISMFGHDRTVAVLVQSGRQQLIISEDNATIQSEPFFPYD